VVGAQVIRLDTLPMNRQVAGSGRRQAQSGTLAPQSLLPALYEQRDVDPEAELFKRRHGSQRTTNVSPNLLGASVVVDKGSIRVDRNFNSEIVQDWAAFGTLRCPTGTAPVDSYFPVFNLNACHVYVKHAYATNIVSLQIYTAANALILSKDLGDLDTAGSDYRFYVARDNTSIVINTWVVPAAGESASVGSDGTASFTFDDTTNELTFFGALLGGTPYHGVVLTNFLLYNAEVFGTGDYDTFASDTTPETSITSPGTALLLWHDTFADGGEVLYYENNASQDVFSYLVPSKPVDFSPTVGVDPTEIHFGGRGVIEIPFYLDFDEYYWTSVNASARLDWVFQLHITMPSKIEACTVFEFQDWLRLRVVDDSGTFKLKGEFHNNTSSAMSSEAVLTGRPYYIFAARDATKVYLKAVNVLADSSNEAEAAASNPIIFNYDKTLGFVIGDTVDSQNSEPFGGKLTSFALHNNSTRQFQEVNDSVIYYDVESVYGDEIIDRGNRSLNGYAGARTTTAPPFYREGGFPGGSYVAANGGYIISNSSPSLGYSGELLRPLTKDAVIQRRGKLAFLTSNEVSYVIDDFSKTFRPLGIPRPSTKVSSTPIGVGPIDGFVRYAYRFVTENGTVGPVFELDPCDARGGVQVFLGAETHGLPDETGFGLSYGECEGTTSGGGRGLVASETVETFIAHDNDGSGDADPTLLHKEIGGIGTPGLTIETAFRIPNLTSISESVIGQGVCMPYGPIRWASRGAPQEFPWIGGAGSECTFQFSFRFLDDAPGTNQTLFCIGAEDQFYETGLFDSDHWRLHHLVVSIQGPEARPGNQFSIVVCRDAPGGSNHRDDDLHHWAQDYNFLDGNDYSVFISRCGYNYGAASGADLSIAIFNHTAHDPGVTNGWKMWPHDADASQIINENFWGSGYVGSARDQIMWGCCRLQGSGARALEGKSRTRTTPGSDTFGFARLKAFHNGATAGNLDGQRMYHGRMWRRDIMLPVLAQTAISRYGSWMGEISEELEVDVAFCSDSSQDALSGGWSREVETDEPTAGGVRTKYWSRAASSCSETDARTVMSENLTQSPILAYGYDNTITAADPDTHATTTLDKVPLWASYSSRNEGSLAVGTGQDVAVEIATKKWHDGSQILTFDQFGTTIDLKQWTWLTFYYHHITRLGGVDEIDLWLERLFVDGMTDNENFYFFQSDTTANGPGGLSKNLTAGSGQFTLFTCGGLPGIDQEFEVEIAETRLWVGNRYTAEGATNGGTETFGPFMSTRVPPNYWSLMTHYLRFAPLDLNDEDTPTAMDQLGQYEDSDEETQLSADAVTVYQGADVKRGDEDTTGGSNYYTPFPNPPMNAIRGIQIFRSQIVPVIDEFPGTGEPNPNAVADGFRACSAAPLYFMSEIPDGTEFYIDAALDTTLGAQLDLTAGLVPREPMGVFEWQGYVGIWTKDRPRIHFSASPSSWESFPTDMVLDLPLREYGVIQAASELASRDARGARVLVLGKSWGAFLDGSPAQPLVNSLGGGIGASSSRCLVIEKGIAYAYNGTLWAITGDGAVEDIGLPVLDLLPDPENCRLSVSSTLSSLFVIDESTGLAIRYHFARREWFVEDRYALSTTDIDGVDYWVNLGGFPSKGVSTVYQDDVETNTTAAPYVVSSFNNGANTFVVSSATGLKVDQRLTLVADRSGGDTIDARERQTVTISAISGTTITVNEDLDLNGTVTEDGASLSVLYNAYVGVGYWGTMLDTGQFNVKGSVDHVDLGISSGDRWYAAAEAADFAKDPSDRTGFDAGESKPAHLVNDSNVGESFRWGIAGRQRLQRLLIWSPMGDGSGLTEAELNYTAEY